MKPKILKLLLPAIALPILAIATVVLAGTLNPSASPAATMYTLNDIYQRLVVGTSATEANHSLVPSASPAATMYTLKQLYQAIPSRGSNVAGGDSQLSFLVPSGVYSGSQTCTASDANLVAGNIKSGTAIFGTTGNYVGPRYYPSNCPTPRYTDNGDGTISDNCTNLIWTKCSLNSTGGITDAIGCTDTIGASFTQAAASSGCDALNLSVYSDWRLPSIAELETIVDYTIPVVSINATIFPNTQAGGYWSSTIDTAAPSTGWYMDFSTGLNLNHDDTPSPFSARCVRGVSSASSASINYYFTIKSIPVVAAEGSSVAVVVKDANFTRNIGPTVDNNAQVALNASQGFLTNLAYSSANTNIATVDSNGYVTRVSDGTVQINATSTEHSGTTIVTVSRTQPAIQDTFLSYITGSFAKECSDSIDTRIAGKSPDTTINIFTTQDHTTPTYVRNTNTWLTNINLTAISPWNSTGGVTRAGVAISPRHIAFANHYPIAIGATIRFITADNQVITRTVTNEERVDDTDIMIGLLDSALPATITPVEVLPANIASYLPNISQRIPILGLDQSERATVADLVGLPDGWAGGVVPINSQRLLFYRTKISGDSGNPAFLIHNNKLALLTTWYYGGSGTGNNYSQYISSINSAMSDLGGDYTLTTADLSSFPTY